MPPDIQFHCRQIETFFFFFFFFFAKICKRNFENLHITIILLLLILLLLLLLLIIIIIIIIIRKGPEQVRVYH